MFLTYLKSFANPQISTGHSIDWPGSYLFELGPGYPSTRNPTFEADQAPPGLVSPSLAVQRPRIETTEEQELRSLGSAIREADQRPRHGAQGQKKLRPPKDLGFCSIQKGVLPPFQMFNTHPGPVEERSLPST